MKKYQKRSGLQEKTAMGYKTLIDEFDMDNVNDALSKVPGMEFAMHLGSKVPRPIKGGGYSSLKIEDINESVANITEGMDGLFDVKKKENLEPIKESQTQKAKTKLTESRDTFELFSSAFEQVADDLKDGNLIKNPKVYGENVGRMSSSSIFKNLEDADDPGLQSALEFLKGFVSGVIRSAK